MAAKKLALKSARTAAAQSAEGAGVETQPPGPVPPQFGLGEKPPSYAVVGVLGILGVLMFAALVFLQWVEWSDYSQPGLFPVLKSGAFAGAATPADASGNTQPAVAAGPETEAAPEADASADAAATNPE